WTSPDVTAAIRQQRRLALFYLAMGHLRQARFEMESAIETADSHSCTAESGILRVNLAVALTKSGDIGRASELLDEAQAHLESAGRGKWLLLADMVRANIFRIGGAPARGLDILSRALVVTREEKY